MERHSTVVIIGLIPLRALPRLCHESGINSIKAFVAEDDPKNAVTTFKHVGEILGGSAVADSVVGEAISVKAAQPIASAEPHESVGIAHQAVDAAAPQAVLRGVLAHGESLRQGPDGSDPKEGKRGN